ATISSQAYAYYMQNVPFCIFVPTAHRDLSLDCFPFPDTAARGVIKVRNFQQYGVLLFTAVMHQPVLAIVVITV
ncbi:hypothetical protein P2Q74_25350, partial [Escherichia coli]